MLIMMLTQRFYRQVHAMQSNFQQRGTSKKHSSRNR